MLQGLPSSTLFPYTTLFRSRLDWPGEARAGTGRARRGDRKRFAGDRRAERVQYLRSEGTRLNSSHVKISYAVFCLKKKNIRYHILESSLRDTVYAVVNAIVM